MGEGAGRHLQQTMGEHEYESLKERVARSAYSVNPWHVAAAVIAKLVQPEDASVPEPTPDGPSRAGGPESHLRQAA